MALRLRVLELENLNSDQLAAARAPSVWLNS